MYTNIKKILSLMLAAMLVFSVFAVNVSAASPKISKTAVSVNVGKTVTLKVTGYSKTVKWASGDKTVATVTSKGVVKGITVGSTTVTATAGNKKLSCKITVKSSVIPSGAKEYNGHTYYLYTGKYTWTKAEALCEAKGGHLATVTSSGEQKFIQSFIKKNGNTDFWIGGTDAEKEGTWKWVTGETFKYSNWGPGEPDNSSDEDYLEIWGKNDNYKWNDDDNANSYISGYICEWDTTKAKASAFRFTSSAANVTYGATKTLKVINTAATPTWSSSNKSVATVSSKGVVTGKALGKAVISAKVGKKISKCTVTVKDVNATASVSFKSSDGGVFVKGYTATATFKPKAKCAKATVSVVNASGTNVYSKSYTKLAKDTSYSFKWNGQKSDGSYVSAGSYRIKVVIGTKTSYSSYLKFEKTNPFAGGNGSKSAPFLVGTVAQFKKIGKYPTASFKQTAELDFEYSAVNMFSVDNPFNGTYDGNGKTISNIIGKSAIFECIGTKGNVKNVKIKKASITTEDFGVIITYENHGKITNCEVEGSVISSYTGLINVSMICGTNHGTISNCSASGTVKCTGYHDGGWAVNVYAGGIVCANMEDGKIISCNSSVNVSSNADGSAFSGGITSFNLGFITDCTANGSVYAYGKGYTSSKSCAGGIAGVNQGQISDSAYMGESDVGIAAENTGVIN